MDILLSHDTINSFAKLYPKDEQISSIMAATVIGIRTLQDQFFQVDSLWKIANSLQAGPKSLLEKPLNLDCPAVKKENAPVYRHKVQETPRFSFEASVPNRSSSSCSFYNKHKSVRRIKKDKIAKLKSENSEILHIADHFLNDPFLSKLIQPEREPVSFRQHEFTPVVKNHRLFNSKHNLM